MGRALELYCRGLQVVTVALLAVMVMLVFGNVVLRYAFNSGITVSEELSRWLFVWLTFLGSIVALREHRHLGTDVLLKRLGRRERVACLLVGHLLMLWVCWLVFSGALDQTRLNWTVAAPSSGLALAWFYASGVVFAVSAGLILLHQMAGILRGTARPDAMGGEERL